MKVLSIFKRKLTTMKKTMFLLVGIFAVLFLVPMFWGLDLWEFFDQKVKKGSSVYLTGFFVTVGAIAFVYTVIKTIVSAKNTINEFKD